eukprot:3207897-Amphidinium_carterae.1
MQFLRASSYVLPTTTDTIPRDVLCAVYFAKQRGNAHQLVPFLALKHEQPGTTELACVHGSVLASPLSSSTHQ